MQLELVPRQTASRAFAFGAPLIAVAVTLVVAALIFLALGVDPVRGLQVYFVAPLTQAWSLEELMVKAAPLVLIGTGLALCYRSNNWNIGAEGQLTVGALCGASIPILLPEAAGAWVLPTMLALGVLGGAAYAAIPALLKNRFGTNDVLTSLMLVYVALLLLDWLVRGPWRDPAGFNFPESRLFGAAATLPSLIPDTRVHLGILFAPLAVLATAVLMRRMRLGMAIDAVGASPRAARFAGFEANRLTLVTFLLSGGLAGLAGICEVSGPIGQLTPEISPGYGFTAIIVAFLGRLRPLGVLAAGLVLALTFLGGEGAQVSLRVSDNVTRVLQGLLLFSLLASETLVHNRVRIRRRHRAPMAEEATS